MFRENDSSNSIDKGLLTNIIINSYRTALVIAITLYLVKSHLPDGVAGGFFYGSVCGTTNLYFMRGLLREMTNPDGSKAIKAILSGVGLIGIVVAFFYALWGEWFNEAAMVTGFSYFILMTVIMGIFQKKKGSTE